MKDECAICFNEYEITNKLKYKCSVCDKKICNNCFLNYIKHSNRCIFCRNTLVIILPVSNNSNNENEIMMYRRKKKINCVIICCFFCTFFFFICISVVPNNNLKSNFNTTNINYNISY